MEKNLLFRSMKNIQTRLYYLKIMSTLKLIFR